MTPRSSLSTLLLAAMAFAGAPRTAVADPPALVAAPPRLKTLKLPTEPSDTPTRQEWKSAPLVTLERPLPEDCEARLKREWLRVRCRKLFPAGGSVVSGPAKGVTFYGMVPKNAQGSTDREGGLIDAVIPLRPGVSRIVQLTRMTGGGYEGFFAQGRVLLLSQQWPEGDPGPTLDPEHNDFDDRSVLGMRLVDQEGAKAAGIKGRQDSLTIAEVEKGSAAERAGAQVGDHIESFFNDDWPAIIAFTHRRADLLVIRKGGAKELRFWRRPEPPKPLAGD